MAGERPKDVLALARLLRVIHRRGMHGDRPQDCLDVVDRRTLSGLLRRGGVLSGQPDDLPRAISEFVKNQRLVGDVPLLEAVRVAIAREYGLKE
jgi:hypothetical protein